MPTSIHIKEYLKNTQEFKRQKRIWVCKTEEWESVVVNSNNVNYSSYKPVITLIEELADSLLDAGSNTFWLYYLMNVTLYNQKQQ